MRLQNLTTFLRGYTREEVDYVEERVFNCSIGI